MAFFFPNHPPRPLLTVEWVLGAFCFLLLAVTLGALPDDCEAIDADRLVTPSSFALRALRAPAE
jgi:hypothetical protein